MSLAQPSAADRKKADALYQEALNAYQRWDIEEALKQFQAAVKLAPNRAEYHLSLAQALARA